MRDRLPLVRLRYSSAFLCGLFPLRSLGHLSLNDVFPAPATRDAWQPALFCSPRSLTCGAGFGFFRDCDNAFAPANRACECELLVGVFSCSAAIHTPAHWSLNRYGTFSFACLADRPAKWICPASFAKGTFYILNRHFTPPL